MKNRVQNEGCAILMVGHTISIYPMPLYVYAGYDSNTMSLSIKINSRIL